jgi:hypothetical protein
MTELSKNAQVPQCDKTAVSGSTLKKLTISGIFNDYFTNYEDKESSVSMTVDVVKDCTCVEKRCLIHEMPSNYVLSELP